MTVEPNVHRDVRNNQVQSICINGQGWGEVGEVRGSFRVCIEAFLSEMTLARKCVWHNQFQSIRERPRISSSADMLKRASLYVVVKRSLPWNKQQSHAVCHETNSSHTMIAVKQTLVARSLPWNKLQSNAVCRETKNCGLETQRWISDSHLLRAF